MSSLIVYRAMMRVISPLLRAVMHRRARRGREEGARLGERFGKPGQERPEGGLLWIHAVSVGEACAAFPLVRRLRADYELEVLFTTGTVSAARRIEQTLGGAVIHQYLPCDHPRWNARFLDHWRPDAVLWLESDYWPDILARVHARGIPAALANARISERSLKRWRLLPGLIRAALAGFRPCLVAGPEQLASMRQLGASAPDYVGNLKAAAPPLTGETPAAREFREALGDRFRWAATCTHAGEEVLIADVHRQLRERWPDLITLIAPRHSTRGPAIGAELEKQGLKVSRREAGELPGPDDDIHLVDTLGELGLVYAESPVSFIGGSLVPSGSHNPWEAAHMDSVVLHGPYVENAESTYGHLDHAGAARYVETSTELAGVVDALFAAPARAYQMTRNARACLREEGDILNRTLDALGPVLATFPRRATAASDESRPRAVADLAQRR